MLYETFLNFLHVPFLSILHDLSKDPYSHNKVSHYLNPTQMEVATQAPFASSRIQDRFEAAAATFLLQAHNSKVAHAVLAHLKAAESDKTYATGSRNECVARLATAVETELDLTANLMFRTPGALHDALQSLMDAYEDAMDGIYYHSE